MTVFDLRGKPVYNEEFIFLSENLVKPVDLSSFSKGAYIMKLQTPEDLKVVKIVIQ
jgi:hypothetical protein